MSATPVPEICSELMEVCLQKLGTNILKRVLFRISRTYDIEIISHYDKIKEPCPVHL